MREQLLVIKNTIQDKSRLSFIFKKKTLVLSIDKSLDELEITLSKLENNLKETTENYINSVKKGEELQSNLTTLNAKYSQLNQDYDKSVQYGDKLESDLKTLSEKHIKLNQNYEELYFKNNLIAHLLKANYIHEGVREYESILENDFMEFANEESSLKEEALALLKLQRIGKELRSISSYPEFYNKKVVAVGGGFSAGKSEFISSLFENDAVKLPVGIKPTTAIPTYVMNSDDVRLLGASPKGEMIDLLKIEPNIYKKLSHDFIRSFGFNLKDIMPYMVLTNKLSYKHICFVDTPGYNPSSSEQSHTNEDRETADNFIKEAGALIWLIPVTAGTIPQSDLEFLDEATSEKKTLYVVLNKCDQRPLSDVEDIMEEIATELDNYGIEYQGISAYSSKMKKEYSYCKKSLKAFFIEQDLEINRIQEIYESLDSVNVMYKKAIQADIKKNKKIKDKLFTIRQSLASNWRNDDEDKVDELMKYFDISSQESHLLRLKSVMEKFNNALEMIFPKRILLNKEINENESWFSNISGLTLSSLESDKKEQIKKVISLVKLVCNKKQETH
ncbi:dynamin family protein [Haemophilus haemolyticus]|uniref:dynamin family protein n=1 Tax=Haemophilus haemolyticus TaxID=726 RepID=UPI000E58BD72|nr:dynamin family protein [Haemophilus haemolyticus]